MQHATVFKVFPSAVVTVFPSVVATVFPSSDRATQSRNEERAQVSGLKILS